MMMRVRKRIAGMMLTVCVLGMVTTRPGAADATITTDALLTGTLAATLSCLAWQPVGVCLWLRCTPFGCSVETSFKFGHYAPQHVVSVFNEVGQNPYTEARALWGGVAAAAASAQMGALGFPIAEGGVNVVDDTRTVTVREVEVIGHPLIAPSYALDTTEVLCPIVGALPMAPHLLSGLDALAWRLDIPEIVFPPSFIPGLREIGQFPFWTWGNVYPRNGWVAGQTDEYKVAATLMQRGADIVTNVGSPHVYIPSPSGGAIHTFGMRVWNPPYPVMERDQRGGKWQALSPVYEPYCKLWGDSDLVQPTSEGGGKIDAQGDYVANLWRPFQCCSTEGSFLFSIDVLPFPLP